MSAGFKAPVRATLILAALLAASCAVIRGPQADATQFFSLTAPASAAKPAPGPPPARLLVRRVEIPEYLKSKVFAVRAEGGEIRYVEDHWWSEPLDLAIGRIVRERVGTVTGISAVDRGDAQYDLEAVVRISRFEGEVGAGNSLVRLVGSIELIDPATGRHRADQRVNLEEPWDGKDYASLAKLMGAEAGKLADAVIAANK